MRLLRLRRGGDCSHPAGRLIMNRVTLESMWHRRARCAAERSSRPVSALSEPRERHIGTLCRGRFVNPQRAGPPSCPRLRGDRSPADESRAIFQKLIVMACGGVCPLPREVSRMACRVSARECANGAKNNRFPHRDRRADENQALLLDALESRRRHALAVGDLSPRLAIRN